MPTNEKEGSSNVFMSDDVQSKGFDFSIWHVEHVGRKNLFGKQT
jgi:hypothetical protein